MIQKVGGIILVATNLGKTLPRQAGHLKSGKGTAEIVDLVQEGSLGDVIGRKICF